MKENMYIISLFVMVVSFILGLLIGSGLTRDHMRNDAVKSGVGEWVIEYSEKDFSDVKRSFRWKARN